MAHSVTVTVKKVAVFETLWITTINIVNESGLIGLK